MGQELSCRMHRGNRTLSGKAFLETDRILFRGDERVKILFKELKAAKAEAGTLLLEFAGGPARLELGAAAEKWAAKILSPPSRANKLGVKEGLAVRVVGEFDADFFSELQGTQAAKKQADLVFFAAAKAKDLERIPKLIGALKPAGALWVVYPKGVKQIREIEVLSAGRAAGLTDVKVASFSATHTALKFVIPVARRAEGRKGTGAALAIALMALACTLHAADKVYVLKAARMFDGKSDHVVSPGLVVVAGSKIAAVGPNAAILIGAETIDLGDATLLPGLMDAHTHLSDPYERDYRNQELDLLKKPISERALDAIENLRKTIMAGVTSVRDLGGEDYIDVGLRNAAADGKIPGPRMLVSVHALGATGGHCDPYAGYAPGIFNRDSDYRDGVINSPDEARLAVRYNIRHGADVIKTCATGGVLSLTDDVDTPQLTQAELDALVDEAHALRRKAAAHAHGAAGAKRAIRAGIDSIEHGSFLDDEALDMMKQRGTFFVPTVMAAQGLKERLTDGYLPPPVAGKARQAIAALDDTVRKAIAKGVRIAVGTDATVYPHGRNPEEFGLLVKLGMKPVDALKAGTSVDAELLGISGKTGTLETGKLADIVACPGNPEADIRAVEKIRFVMKEGVVLRKD